MARSERVLRQAMDGSRRDYGPQGCAARAVALTALPLLLAALARKGREK
jgi:hypothetical protein